MTTKIHYQIRNPYTGLYSPGGSDADRVKWSKNGKVWTSIGALKNHLRQFVKTVSYNPIREVNAIPEHWEVVTIEVVQAEKPGTQLARDLITVAS